MTNKIHIVHSNHNTDFSNLLKNAVEKCPASCYYQISESEIESTTLLDGSSLYCFDYATVKTIANQLKQLTDTNKYCFTAVYNAPETISTSELVRLGRLKGYIGSSASESEMANAINTLISGQSALPLSIANQLVKYYQSLILRFSEPYAINLTQREVQVLERLRFGLSNNKLADELFVSEHTVKSHLYKIFKKINVSNRTQAIAWTHKYLP